MGQTWSSSPGKATWEIRNGLNGSPGSPILLRYMFFLQFLTDFSQKRAELEGRAAPQVQSSEDPQPEFARTSNSDFEVPSSSSSSSSVATTLWTKSFEAEDGSNTGKQIAKIIGNIKLQWKGPAPSRTPTGWNFSRFLPHWSPLRSITSLIFPTVHPPPSNRSLSKIIRWSSSVSLFFFFHTCLRL